MSGITPCLWFDGNAEDAASSMLPCSPTAMLMQSIAHRVIILQARQATSATAATRGSKLTGEIPFAAPNSDPRKCVWLPSAFRPGRVRQVADGFSIRALHKKRRG
jgi:hypothetical protein